MQARAWVEPGRCRCHPASPVGKRKQKEREVRGRGLAVSSQRPEHKEAEEARLQEAVGRGPLPVVLRPGFQSCFCPFHSVVLGKDTVPSLCWVPPSKSSGRKAPPQN